MIDVNDAQPADAASWRAIVLEAAEEAAQIVTTPEEVWSAQALTERFANAGGGRAYLVAQAEGFVVGVLGLARGERRANRHTAEVGIAVARAWRGRGAGRRLLAAADNRAREWGVRKMCLGVFATNERAHRLYRSLGYEDEGVRRGQYLVGGMLRDEILMGKWIA